MRLRPILLLCVVIVVGFIIIYVVPKWNTPESSLQQKEQSEQQSGRRSEWTRKTVDGVELWIAWEKIQHLSFGTRLTILAYMEGKYFNEETLRKLFARMSEEYTDYSFLLIDIFSDEAKLAQRANDSRTTMPHISRPPEKPTEVQTPSNYFLAGYFRATWPNGLQEENFSYNPDPTKDDRITITLKP